MISPLLSHTNASRQAKIATESKDSLQFWRGRRVPLKQSIWAEQIQNSPRNPREPTRNPVPRKPPNRQGDRSSNPGTQAPQKKQNKNKNKKGVRPLLPENQAGITRRKAQTPRENHATVQHPPSKLGSGLRPPIGSSRTQKPSGGRRAGDFRLGGFGDGRGEGESSPAAVSCRLGEPFSPLDGSGRCGDWVEFVASLDGEEGPVHYQVTLPAIRGWPGPSTAAPPNLRLLFLSV